MAITVLNSQGTKVYIAPAATDISDCTKVKTALGTAKLVGCPQSLGEIAETRSVTEYKCLSSNESAKALGAISRGSLEIGLLLDIDDATNTSAGGQAALKDAFKNNKEVVVFIELPNGTPAGPSGTPAGKHGTLYMFKAGVSGVGTTIEQDAAISYKVTLEISSDIKECPKEA